MSRGPRSWVALVLGGALIGALTTSAVASVGAGPRSVLVGHGLPSIKVVRSTGSSTTKGKRWVDLPGAALQFNVPAGSRYIFIARFAAMSNCIVAPGYCTVRITVNGHEAEPAEGFHFHFDVPNAETHAMGIDRSAGPFGPGRYSVRVQFATNGIRSSDNYPSLTLSDWSLTVQAALA